MATEAATTTGSNESGDGAGRGAALFFEDAMEERAKDAIDGNISFNYGWIIDIPRTEEDRRMLSTSFATNYKVGTCDWNVQLRLRSSPFGLAGTNTSRRHGSLGQAHFMVETARNTKVMGGTCFIAYTIYHDEEMRYEYYTSPRISAPSTPGMITDGLRFRTPQGKFIQKLVNAIKKNEGKKVAVYIELQLPSRFFLRNFEDAAFPHKRLYQYPADIEDDFRFEFTRNGDYTLKCPDGEVKASRQALYLSSLFFRNFLSSSSYSRDFQIRHHSVDVVTPVIWYLHSLCFQMPVSYDLDYARRIIDAIEFFHPVNKNEILTGVHRALCKKLADENPNFDQICQMAALAARYRFHELKNMACSLIANEYYARFKAAFPENDMNLVAAPYRDLFMTQNFIGQTPFDLVDKIHRNGFKTKVILR